MDTENEGAVGKFRLYFLFFPLFPPIPNTFRMHELTFCKFHPDGLPLQKVIAHYNP